VPIYDFGGAVAFVTGAARGQGRSHAVRYAENGADIVVLDTARPVPTSRYPLATEADVEETVRRVEATGQRALLVRADVREEDEVAAAVDTALDEFGRIDVLANNAGIWNVADLVERDERQWRELLNTDLKGAWLCAKHVG
jgi:NAD(P)-dependent dehydrogenase (short-subunit alcohol dehydrogenase family)